MTDFALGVKCGFPSGGCHVVSSPRATPSLNNIALSARPVKPMPVSARNERRVMPGQRAWRLGLAFIEWSQIHCDSAAQSSALPSPFPPTNFLSVLREIHGTASAHRRLECAPGCARKTDVQTNPFHQRFASPIFL